MTANLSKLRKMSAGLINALIKADQKELADGLITLAVQHGMWKDPAQRPEDYSPALKARPVHDAKGFRIVEYLEKNFQTIRDEVSAVTDPVKGGFRPVEEPLANTGRWDGAIFYEAGHRYELPAAQFPETAKLLDAIPVEERSAGVIMFSWLHPGTHLIPHCGHTNTRLRIHLGIQTPDDAVLRVKDQFLSWQEGKCIVFDDSFEHEVWNAGTKPRIIMLFDTFHPDLTSEQRKALCPHANIYEMKIQEFMRSHGLEMIECTDDESIRMYPDAGAAMLIRRHMGDARIQSAALIDGVLKLSKAEAPVLV
jgi:aspartate beta-hydroxylase